MQLSTYLCTKYMYTIFCQIVPFSISLDCDSCELHQFDRILRKPAVQNVVFLLRCCNAMWVPFFSKNWRIFILIFMLNIKAWKIKSLKIVLNTMKYENLQDVGNI